MNLLLKLFGKKQPAAKTNEKLHATFHDHEFRFIKFKIEGILPISWEEMTDGRRYEVYRSNTKAKALEFLKNIPVEEIPRLFYVIVETPQGNVGKDIEGVFDEP